MADLNAKEASTFPLITTPNYNPMDWNKYIIKEVTRQYKLNLMNDSSIWYKNLNREMTNICSFLRSKTGYSRIDIIKFVRLRLGHSKLTHGNLMNIPTPKICNCLSPTLNPSHILVHCPNFYNKRQIEFGDTDPIRTLSNPTPENISKIIKFLKSTNTYNLI